MSDTIAINDIVIEKRLLTYNSRTLTALKASISALGLLSPPIVRKTDKGYKLVTGATRVEACRQLGWKEIPIEIDKKHADDDEWASLAEIDENLARRSMSPVERARIITKRKKLAPGPTAPFAADIAKKTGLNRKTIERDVKVGQTLGTATLEKLKDTSLDNRDELQALTKMDPERRRNLVARAAKGEQVSALPKTSSPKTNRLMSAWSKATEAERTAFLQHLRRIKAI